MKFFFTLLMCFLLLTTVQAQNVSVNATSATLTGSYPTLKDAFDAVNNGTHKGAIIIKIHNNTTESATANLDSSGNSGGSSYTSVRMLPADTATVTKTISFTSAVIVGINFTGADSVIIDGRPSGAGTTSLLEIAILSSAANTFTMRMQSGVQNSIIRYTKLTGVSNPSINTTINLFIVTGSNTANRNITIENNILTSAAQGIQVVGTTALPATDIIISKNMIRNYRTLGIILSGGIQSITVDSNFIMHENAYASNETAILYGIDLNFTPGVNNYVYNITRNTIVNLAMLNATSSSGIQGIRIFPNATSTNSLLNIINNSISLTRANNGINGNQVMQGIRYTGSVSATTVNVINNTVRIGGQAIGGTNGTINSIGFIKANTTASTTNNFFNNVIINERTSNTALLSVGFWMNSLAGTNNMDYNNYYVSPGNYNAAWNGFVYYTAASYANAASPREQHSSMGYVNFNGANDLSIAPASQGDFQNLLGTPSALALKDLTGATRAALYPYKGAFEGQPFAQHDASVAAVYTLGKLPLTGANPHTIKAAVSNTGFDTLFAVKVYAGISAPNAHTDSVTIDTLLSGQTKTVSFAPYLYTSAGSDTVTIRLLNDDANANNSKSVVQLINNDQYGYIHPGIAATGGTSAADRYAVLFPYTGNALLSKVFVPTNNSGYAYQVEIRSVVNDTPGTVLWSSLQQSSLGYDTVVVPAVNISGSFFVVIKQNGPALGLSYFDESPLRPRTFFSQTGTQSWKYLDSTTTMHLMIDVQFSTAVQITAQPQSRTVCSGSAVQMRVAAQNASSFRWQEFVSLWNDLSNTGVYSGTTDDTLIISNTAGLNGRKYRCLVYGADTVASDSAILTVDSAIAGNTITGTQTICKGTAPASFTGATPTGGNGTTYTYRWIKSNSGDSTVFVNAAGNDSALNYTAGALSQPTWFKRIVTSGICGTDSSAAIKISITDTIKTNSITGTQNVCSGSTPTTLTGSTPTGGNGTTYTYSWIASTTNNTTGFTAATGTNNAKDYSPASLSQSTWFKRVVTSGVCSADTSVAVKITVNPVYSVNNPQTICEGKSYVFNSHTYTTAGTYRDTLNTVNACDSIIVTQLTVNPRVSTNNPQTICEGSSYIFNAHTYTVAGTYRDTLHAANGCDSIIVTQLTVNPRVSSNNPQTICEGTSYILNAHTYTVAGTYRDTLHAANGCDSIIVTQLTVNPKPATSAISGNVNPMINTTETYSVVNTSGSTYNWIIENGTQQSGTNTNSITVLWSALGAAKVKVIETNSNSCKGDTISQVATVLPVKLISFNGKRMNNDVVLTWATASELNNNRFEVLRSANGKTFEKIGSVKGNGTTSIVSNYTYTDAGAFSNQQLYYKLAQYDMDGTMAESRVITIDAGTSGKTIHTPLVMPNPYSTQAVIVLHSENKETINITVTDLSGKTVLTQTATLVSGSNTINIEQAETLNDGLYFITLKQGDEMHVMKLLRRAE